MGATPTRPISNTHKYSSGVYMLSFRQMMPIITEETVRNKHLDHLEDLMILKGADGLKLSIAFLKDITESLKTGSTTMGMSTKWDGKPAIVCGINPTNKKFFVATKGAFSKTVLAFHTEEEIKKTIIIPDLASKLVECLKYLPKLGIKGVLQGDLMFTKDSKKPKTIEGKEYITFTPNTIMYAIGKNSEVGQRVNAAKIGIVFHTEYSGKTMESLSATSFNFNANTLKKNADVWCTDPNIYDITPALLQPAEHTTLTGMISSCETKAKVVSPFLKTLNANKTLMEYIMPYINSTINGGMSQFSSGGLKLNLQTKFGKEIEKLKTEKGKLGKKQTMDSMLAFVDAYDGQFNSLFELHNLIANAKEILIGKFNILSHFGHFFVDEDGIRPTSPEGIVISRSGNVVKLVNRLRFSRQNRKINS